MATQFTGKIELDIRGVGYLRTGVAEGTHTPVGGATLYVDGDAVATLAGAFAKD